MLIRPGTAADARDLQDIERLAGARFRDVGLSDVADDDPFPIDVLGTYAAEGRCWVAVDESGDRVGYVVVDVVDGNAHVEQVSVHPDQQGKGIGRALMEHVAGWAADRKMPAVTLTTFRDVPWNGPMYRHLGFRDLADDEIGPELRAVRDAETAHGLDPNLRVCMRLDVS